MASAGIWMPVIGFGRDLSYEAVIAGTKAGVADYCVGDIDSRTLVRKIEAAHEAGQKVRARQMSKAKSRMLLSSLSARERQVLDLLAQGASNKTMARDLLISPRTVEIHRMKMMSKLGAKTSAEAIRLALEATMIL